MLIQKYFHPIVVCEKMHLLAMLIAILNAFIGWPAVLPIWTDVYK